MTWTDRQTGLEALPREDCLALLRAQEVGRFVCVAGGQPHIVPVNYVLDGETIVFRTDMGTKLREAERAAVAFEIDGLDRVARTGWSVVVHGRAEEITTFDGPVRLRSLRDLGVDPWAGGPKLHWIGIQPFTITGRRINHYHELGTSSTSACEADQTDRVRR
jgi:nitroimidazol reductase NimA-like FMN-containing flavoprotein (pyridoxamine 5'-phosphate oxidase superfamily)